MRNRLYLHIPAYDELYYREKLLGDPLTMDYNKCYELDDDGYCNSTGCIAFPQSEWREWYDYFVGNEPARFYAYIIRVYDGAFIGEVNVHQTADNFYDMGIVIEGKYRGQGYAEEALRLLLKYAFENLNAAAVHNDFEETRVAAVKTHIAAGFVKTQQINGIADFLITKEQYFSNKKQ